MFLWNSPNRDSDFDSDVILHEYAHGLSTRLVGGATHRGCAFGIQPGAMGEAWSDYFAVDDTNDPGAGDDPGGPGLVGEYSTGNYTVGIRAQPYSADPLVNTLTYGDICAGDCEVHVDGEVWANMLALRADAARKGVGSGIAAF